MIQLEQVVWNVASPQAGAPPLTILDGVTFELPTASTMAVVGPSGSGKTSLLMMIGGLETPSSGSIRIHDTDISTLSEDGRADFRRQHIGIVFQSFHLAPAMTAVENVMLPLLLSNAPDPTARAMQSLESVGLGHRARHYPAHLSGGENQRCALARALVMQPSVLLADEPTGNLDEDNSNVITDLLFALARENNAAVLLVTHDTQLAKKCDGTLTMRDGKIS